MRIINLVENTEGRAGCGAEHGLSFYIETEHHKLLMDTGQSGLFMQNAEKLGIDLTKVDTVVLSHGHYDHGGGILPFAEINRDAKIYVPEKAFGEYYSVSKAGEPHYIGLAKEIRELPQVVPVESGDGIYRIDDDGIPVQVASSDEGCAYYVCEDNTIRREMTGDDGRWEIDYLDLNGGELVCKDMLVMDESKDTEEPWFVVENIGEMESGGLAIADGNDRMVDEEGFQADYEPISYEDASELRASYVGEALDYTAFK